MKRRTRLVTTAAIAVVGFGGAGTAVIAAGDETDTPIVGPDLQRASDAALAATGEGRITDTEVGDEESYYEIEVTLDDCTEVDVQLDDNFQVVGTEDESASNDSD